MKLCTGSTERKHLAAAICLAAASLTAIGASDHGANNCFYLAGGDCYFANSLMTALYVFLGVYMAITALRPAKD